MKKDNNQKQNQQNTQEQSRQTAREQGRQTSQEQSGQGQDSANNQDDTLEEKISTSLDWNLEQFQKIFADCDDIKMKKMTLGLSADVDAAIAYIEVSVGNMLVENSVLGKLLNHMCELEKDRIYRTLEVNALGISDMTVFEKFQDAASGLLTGDAILFIDGFAGAVKIPDKGYPAMTIMEPKSEQTVRGSREGFTESIKINAALIRKRIRSPLIKVKQKTCGVRSDTLVFLVYMEDLIQEELLQTIEDRLDRFEVDGVMDSGIVEQLTESSWCSPFPQFQTTKRPDRASMAILEGRILLMTDNSPEVLILPTDYNSFIQTSDDYYRRWEIVSFTRILRYIASVLAMVFPALYLTALNFHAELIPGNLLSTLVQARQGVPFPAVIELMFMELAFELLREAGIRMPGNMGNAIGIVGGLIVGQAAVEANLVSPAVVLVVAFTALCSFTIPNEDFASAFRLMKFVLLILSAILGFAGLWLGIFLLIAHLAHLESFGIPYLMPLSGTDGDILDADKDFLLRTPLSTLKNRPPYANKEQKRKFNWKKQERE